MTDVKWLKIVTNIFDDEKILLIEDMPEADSIIVIWFKLLCLAGKQNNNGVLMMNDEIAYTNKMLSTIFRRKENIVILAIETFKNFGMIEIIDNVITIPNWEKHQSISKLNRIKEQGKLRQQNYRNKQKTIANSEKKHSNVTVTLHNAIEEDKEKEEDKDKEFIYIVEFDESNTDKIKEIISYLNEKANTNFRFKSKANAKHINARINEGYSIEDFKTVIEKKCNEWIGTEFERYLQPSTLFGNKFDQYLNQKTSVVKSNEVGTKSKLPF